MLEEFRLTSICAITLMILTYLVLGYHLVNFVSKMNSGKYENSVMLADGSSECRSNNLLVSADSTSYQGSVTEQ